MRLWLSSLEDDGSFLLHFCRTRYVLTCCSAAALLLLLRPLHCFGFAFCLSIPSAFITLLLGHVICWTADFLTALQQQAACRPIVEPAARVCLPSEQLAHMLSCPASLTEAVWP